MKLKLDIEWHDESGHMILAADRRRLRKKALRSIEFFYWPFDLEAKGSLTDYTDKDGKKFSGSWTLKVLEDK